MDPYLAQLRLVTAMHDDIMLLNLRSTLERLLLLSYQEGALYHPEIASLVRFLDGGQRRIPCQNIPRKTDKQQWRGGLSEALELREPVPATLNNPLRNMQLMKEPLNEIKNKSKTSIQEPVELKLEEEVPELSNPESIRSPKQVEDSPENQQEEKIKKGERSKKMYSCVKYLKLI